MLGDGPLDAHADAVPDVGGRLLVVAVLGLPQPDVLSGHYPQVSIAGCGMGEAGKH